MYGTESHEGLFTSSTTLVKCISIQGEGEPHSLHFGIDIFLAEEKYYKTTYIRYQFYEQFESLEAM